jgi:glycosyltransferase involved in cell wall biosynthesis
VYNGENFLAEALDSMLAQTYEDFELIISDNASTDRTEAICRHYLARDSRVKYVRNTTNLGAARNYNQLIDMAQGEYFKWSAHDDVCKPEFLGKCVSVLDADPGVALCFTQAHGIDENDQFLLAYNNQMDADVVEPWKRFYATACRRHNMTVVMAFGLMRTDVLRRTHKIGAFSSSDRILVGEMALYGRFHMVPEVLFLKRDHPQAHWIQYRTRQERMAWYDTSRKNDRTFPHWRLFQEHLVSIGNAPLSASDRIKCYATMGSWVRFNWRHLLLNLAQRDKPIKSGKAPATDQIERQSANTVQ